MVPLLTAEAAAAFDDLTMSGRDKLLTEQGPEDWPNDFRVARFYPAVEYIQANRARTLGVRQFAKLFEKVDIIVTPSTDEQLIATNLTGNPAVIVPNGLRGADAPAPPAVDDGDHDNIGGPGTPVSITFLGALYQDAKLAAFSHAYQQATGFEKLHPKLDCRFGRWRGSWAEAPLPAQEAEHRRRDAVASAAWADWAASWDAAAQACR